MKVLVRTGSTYPAYVKLWAESDDPEDMADPKPVPGRTRYCSGCGGRHPGLDGRCGYCRYAMKAARRASPSDCHGNAAPSEPHEDRILRYARLAEQRLPLKESS